MSLPPDRLNRAAKLRLWWQQGLDFDRESVGGLLDQVVALQARVDAQAAAVRSAGEALMALAVMTAARDVLADECAQLRQRLQNFAADMAGLEAANRRAWNLSWRGVEDAVVERTESLACAWAFDRGADEIRLGAAARDARHSLVEAEREACARVADEYLSDADGDRVALAIAAAIRARGEHPMWRDPATLKTLAEHPFSPERDRQRARAALATLTGTTTHRHDGPCGDDCVGWAPSVDATARNGAK